MSKSDSVLAERRRQMILQVLGSGPASVTDLSERLEISPATVRRDLIKLEDDSLLTRVHGGAVLTSKGQQANGALAEATGVRTTEKDAVAERAAAMVEDGQTIMLDGGTTTCRLARKLRGRKLTVITGNLMAYEELATEADIDLILVGGVVRRESNSLSGFLAEDTLQQLHADWLFLGTSGVLLGGQVMSTMVVDVPAKRAMIRASDRVALLADHSKFPGVGTVQVCGPEALDVLVTDSHVDQASCAVFKEACVKVIQV